MEENRKIHYEDCFIPNISEGKYRLVWKQNIQVSDIATQKNIAFDRLEIQQEFLIGSSRFRIGPEQVHSVYPPEHSEDCFSTHIPQITFMKEALPWERNIMGNRMPWFILFLFDESDGVEVKQISLNDASWKEQKNKENIYVPEIHLLYGEEGNEKCTVLDIPWEKFIAWIPEKEELQYLAHIRQVSVEDKATHLYRTEGRFSSVIGTRTARNTKESAGKVITYVHLVSLEGYENYTELKEKNEFKKVRMISLYSWEFTNLSSREEGFNKIVNKIDSGNLKLYPKLNDENTSVPKEAQEIKKSIEDMISIGYCPINHDTREGMKTVSWYKSPFVPYFPDISDYPEQNDYQCLNQADAALGYFDNLCMLDETYAAAWQIGRLISLRNSVFLNSLYEIRRENYKRDSYKRSKAYISELLKYKEQKDAENLEYSVNQLDVKSSKGSELKKRDNLHRQLQ